MWESRYFQILNTLFVSPSNLTVQQCHFVIKNRNTKFFKSVVFLFSCYGTFTSKSLYNNNMSHIFLFFRKHSYHGMSVSGKQMKMPKVSTVCSESPNYWLHPSHRKKNCSSLLSAYTFLKLRLIFTSAYYLRKDLSMNKKTKKILF